MKSPGFAVALVTLAVAAAPLSAQLNRQYAQELKTAEHDVPFLVETLQLKPGMTVADVGAGGGAVSLVLSKWIGPNGRVYSTDIGATQLTWIRGLVAENQLTNVTVIEGAPAATNLPPACCDAIFMRDVYHHIGMDASAAFDKSLMESLKPGGRLAIIDFLPRPGSRVPEGVNPDRVGHGITPAVIIEEISAAGLKTAQRISTWPPDSTDKAPFFLVLFRRD